MVIIVTQTKFLGPPTAENPIGVAVVAFAAVGGPTGFGGSPMVRPPR